MIWQAIAERQALLIEELTSLCSDILTQLSQYKNVEAEEERLKELEEKGK